MQYSKGDYISHMTSRYLLPFIQQCHVAVRSLSVWLYNLLRTLFEKCGPCSCRKYWNYVLTNENMTVNLRYTIRMNKQIQSLCIGCLHWRVFTRIPMIWRHDKVVWQRRSRAITHHSYITTVWWYSILYHTLCIRKATFFTFKGKRT